MEKMTYAIALENAIATVGADTEVGQKLTALKASLAKKSKGGEKKPTKTQLENETLKAAILEQMVDGEQYTISAIIKGFNGFSDFSVNKVSALVRQLKNDGLVERTEVKGIAYFTKVNA